MKEQPRDISIISDEIRDIETLILTHSEMIKRFPLDPMLKSSLEQCEFRKQFLLDELNENIKLSQNQTIKFIYNNNRNDNNER